MAEMEKLYKKIEFFNKRKPALNKTNLDKISTAIDDIDNRVIGLNQEVQKYHNMAVQYISYEDDLDMLYCEYADGHIRDLGPIGGVLGVKGEKETEYRRKYVNITPENIGAPSKEMFDNVFKKSEDISLNPRWGRNLNVEYCKLVGNVVHAKFTVDRLYLMNTQYIATVYRNFAHPGVTIGEAVANVEGYYFPLAVFPADNLLTIGYLPGMPIYTHKNGPFFADAIVTAKIAVSL